MRLVLLFVFLLSFVSIPAKSIGLETGNFPASKHRVIIIGAGIAGLSAAHVLVKHHIPVVILEARNRIGGRIFSIHPWGPGLDLGASWIHGVDHNPITELAKQQNIATVPTVYDDNALLNKFNSITLYDAAGKKIDDEQKKSIVAIAKKFDDYVNSNLHQLKNKSVNDVLIKFLKGNHVSNTLAYPVQFIVTNMYLYEYAADLSSLAANANQAYEHSPVSGENVIFPDGYSQILPKLTKDVTIKLNQPVKKISYDRNGVDVYTNDHHYHADRVIITVPLGVLKSGTIHFVPSLPQAKQNAIHQLGIAVYDKVYLLFDHPFWDTQSEWIGYIPNNLDETLDFMNLYSFTHKPILLVFTGGTRAKNIEQWSNEKTITYIMDTLKLMYGENIPKPTSYVITRWYKNPLAQGSYSYLPVGADINDYKILAQPVLNRLFFAGEATSDTDPATVHGAYATGIRVAKEVMMVGVLG